MKAMKRRDFLKTGALLGGSALVGGHLSGTAFSGPLALVGEKPLASPMGTPLASQMDRPLNARPIVIASSNGTKAVEKAMEMIKGGYDAIDAVVAGVNIVEDDPNDDSVGYGGLPNEEGVVELDAAVMHGPSYRGGAVAALRNIKNPSKVAKLVMERSDHVLIVGEGALKFAKAHGFKEEDLLTDQSREKWLKWKETLSNEDDWLPPHSIQDTSIGGYMKSYLRHYGTIHCAALDAHGNLSCVTTTSGLAYKIPGRVGDSPIIGAGLYLDNEVGVAGSTGRGEANLLNCSSVMIVEWMRQGKSPEEACLLACKRVNERCREKRLQDEKGRFKANVKFYAVNKKGEHGSAAIWSGEGNYKALYTIHDGTSVKTLEAAYLFKR